MEESRRLGDRLRAARLAKGVSLEEAAAATRIRRSALQALETEDYSALPASVYARGFLANYARYLGLIAEEVLDEFDQQQREGDPPSTEAQSEGQVRKSPIVSPKLVVLILFIVALAVISNFVYQEFLSAGPAPAPAEAAAEVTQTANPSPTAEPPPPTPTAEPSPSPTIAPTPTAISGVVVTLRATTQQVWISVLADGEGLYAGTIGPETNQGTEPLTWTAGQSILIRFGRTGGVEISLNGRELGPLVESQDPVLFEALITDAGELELFVNDEAIQLP